MSQRFQPGDRVRIDIPDETDPDFDRLHDRRGEVVGVQPDDAGRETGDDRDSYLYEIALDDGIALVRWRDLRPAAPADTES
jgi:hypothetical protein